MRVLTYHLILKVHDVFDVIFLLYFFDAPLLRFFNTRTADGVILIPKAKKFVANFLPIDLAHKKFLTFSEI